MSLTVWLFLIIGGGIFALPAYLPPIRNVARRTSTFRYALIVSMSLVTFMIFFLTISHSMVGLLQIYVSCDMVVSDIPCYPVDSEGNYRREIWLRTITPPPFVPADNCFSDNLSICEMVDTINSFKYEGFLKYLASLWSHLIPAFSCGLMVYLITRQVDPQKKKNLKYY